MGVRVIHRAPPPPPFVLFRVGVSAVRGVGERGARAAFRIFTFLRRDLQPPVINCRESFLSVSPLILTPGAQTIWPGARDAVCRTTVAFYVQFVSF